MIITPITVSHFMVQLFLLLAARHVNSVRLFLVPLRGPPSIEPSLVNIAIFDLAGPLASQLQLLHIILLHHIFHSDYVSLVCLLKILGHEIFYLQVPGEHSKRMRLSRIELVRSRFVGNHLPE